MAFKFEKLRVWRVSLEFATNIHFLTHVFPKKKIFSLTSKIKRAADSVSLNIAEGSTGQTNKQFAKFLGYSIRSGIEVVSCLYLAKSRNYIDLSEFKKTVRRNRKTNYKYLGIKENIINYTS
jgi:four helix bundle protein